MSTIASMSLVMRKVWRCDECQWEWIPRSIELPKQCPNRKCRTRSWNHDPNTTKGIPSNQFPVEHEIDWSMSEAAINAGHVKTPHAWNCRCYVCKPPKGA